MLILYLAGSSILTTFFPTSNFFTSSFFLIPAGLFFINLTSCTLLRIIKGVRTQGAQSYGPDIIHIGLLLLMIGAVVSFTTKKEGFVYIAEEEKVILPGEYTLSLQSFEFLRYEDGRPKAWISTVDVFHGEEKVVDSFPIRVNNPLRIGRMNIYQSSYSFDERLVVTATDGTQSVLPSDHPIEREGVEYIFQGFVRDSSTGTIQAARIEKQVDAGSAYMPSTTLHANRGDSFAGLTIIDFLQYELSGLHIKKDPGVPIVFGSFIVIGSGLTVTFLRRSKGAIP